MTNKQKEDWFLRLDPNGRDAIARGKLESLIGSRPHSRPRRPHAIAALLCHGDERRAPISPEVRRQKGRLRVYR